VVELHCKAITPDPPEALSCIDVLAKLDELVITNGV
jgi:hypothetical protein